MEINKDDVSFSSLLIKYYPNYDLDELDVVVILVSDAVLKMQKDILLTCDILSTYMKAKEDDIDASLTKLMSKDIITIEKGHNSSLHSSLDKFKDKLFEDFVKDLILKRSVPKNREDNIYNYIEQLIGRTLSPIERDIVTNWLRSGAKEDMIKEACQRSMTKSGNISFKAADKIILELERSESRKKVGVSTVDEETKKNQEVRDILLNTDWIYHD